MGKSFIFRKHQEQSRLPGSKVALVVYSARTLGADLTRGILHAVIEQQPMPFVDRMLHLLVSAQPGSAATLTAADTHSQNGAGSTEADARASATAAAAALLGGSSHPSLHAVLGAYVEVCKEEGRYPCLVIDDADAAFEDGTDERKQKSVAALRNLVYYTTATKKMSVVIASSDSSESFRLNALGSKKDRWTRTVVVDEVCAAR